MLLQWVSPYAEANLALEVFLRLIRETLGSDLLSVVLCSSIVYEDVAPGYGDLDFLAMTTSEISENLAETAAQERGLRGRRHHDGGPLPSY